jgi:hypothetical protein
MIGKWSEILEQIITEEKLEALSLVMIWSIKVAESLSILVGLVMTCKKPYEKRVSIYSVMNLFSPNLSTSRLVSPHIYTLEEKALMFMSVLDKMSIN